MVNDHDGDATAAQTQEAVFDLVEVVVLILTHSDLSRAEIVDDEQGAVVQHRRECSLVDRAGNVNADALIHVEIYITQLMEGFGDDAYYFARS